MKSKSLSATNPYLKAPNSEHMLARNVTSSTAIETGKSSASYVKRYFDIRRKRAKIVGTVTP